MDLNLSPNTPTEGEPDAPSREDAALDRLKQAGINTEQLEALRAKLAKLRKSDETTGSGSEQPEADASVLPETVDVSGKTRLLSGKDVDWSEYDLDFNVRHLYPLSVQRPTPEGLKWVAMVVD